ncbi:putative reverse transcriptase domain-containing protein [Tanacetum coccineum]
MIFVFVSSHRSYTSVSSDDDLPSWGIPLMEAYEPEAPLSPVHALVYPEYLAPSDDDIAPAEDQPLPAPASPAALSPNYSADSEPAEEDPEEDPEMDPVDYPFDDDEEEPFEEEEHLASADSASPVPDSAPSSEETEPSEIDETAAIPPPPVSLYTIVPLSQTCLQEWRTAPTPPSPSPSPLSPLSSPLPRIPSPPLLLPSPTRRDIIPEADMPLWKRARFAAPSHGFEIRESSAAAAARQPGSTLTRGTELDFMTALEDFKESVTDIAAKHRQDSEEFHTCHQDAHDDRAILQARISTLTRERRFYRHVAIVADREAMWVAQSVADALTEYEANRNSRNGNGYGNDNGSHDSGGGGGRTPHTACECTYSEFLKCQPLNFKGTEGAVGLSQWFEKIESVFYISKCTVEGQVKFTACTLLGGALTWWNSHVRTVEHDAAYLLPWKTLMKMMTENYCLRSELKKLETKLWNLVVKGTDIESYTQRFQELILLCSRMVSDESDKVEKYIGGLPNSI